MIDVDATIPSLLEEANALLEAQEFEKSISLYETVLKLQPENHDAQSVQAFL